MKKFSTFIDEALKPSQFRPLVKNWDSSKLQAYFNKSPLKKDRRAMRLYMPIEAQPLSPMELVRIRMSIESNGVGTFLTSAGYSYTPQSYLDGYASKGNRQVRIGKVLPQTLKQVFANDPIRQVKGKNHMMVISRHPYDIGGMSTDRGWTSCQNLKAGSLCHYVPDDIKAGTIIAYLTTTKDTNLKNPIGRLLIKPYISKKGDTAYAVAPMAYGSATGDFNREVKKWTEALNRDLGVRGSFRLDPTVYNDGMEPTLFLDPKGTITQKADTIIALLSNPGGNRSSYTNTLKHIISKDVDPDVLEKVFYSMTTMKLNDITYEELYQVEKDPSKWNITLQELVAQRYPLNATKQYRANTMPPSVQIVLMENHLGDKNELLTAYVGWDVSALIEGIQKSHIRFSDIVYVKGMSESNVEKIFSHPYKGVDFRYAMLVLIRVAATTQSWSTFKMTDRLFSIMVSQIKRFSKNEGAANDEIINLVAAAYWKSLIDITTVQKTINSMNVFSLLTSYLGNNNLMDILFIAERDGKRVWSKEKEKELASNAPYAYARLVRRGVNAQALKLAADSIAGMLKAPEAFRNILIMELESGTWFNIQPDEIKNVIRVRFQAFNRELK